MKVLGIVGSLRKESYNLKLANLIKDNIDYEMEIVTLENIPMFNEDLEYPAPKSVLELRDKVLNSDLIWIFSPEYNNGIPGVLKNTLDWLGRPRSEELGQVMSKKKVILSGVTPGGFGTINAYNDLVQLMVFLNTNLMARPRLTIPNAEFNLTPDNHFIQDAIKALDRFIKQ